MVPIFSLCSAANSSRSGRRAMLPSSRMISHSTAAGDRPARRAMSQHASVWPARTSTPPGWAMSGNTWPGCTMSSAVAFSEEATFTVKARSWAEMPLAMPSAASIDTVKLVPWRERFCSTIGLRPRRSACDSVIDMQISPRPCLARKLIFSGVTNSAANTRSPSFSRSSSSTRMTISPARIAATISAIGLMAAGSRHQPILLLLLGGAALVLAGLAAHPLGDARRLAGAAAQVVQLGAAHVALSLHLDRGDERRIGLEGALDALARGDLAHDERGVEAAVALGDHHALEGLHALPLALDHVHVDDDRVARGKIRDLALQPLDFFLLDRLDDVHRVSPLIFPVLPAGIRPAASVPLCSASSLRAGPAF